MDHEEIDSKTQARQWVFTANNVDSIDFKCVPDVRYGVYQHETAPTTGTPHLQGYVEFERPKRLSWLKRNMHPTARFAPKCVKSTREQARAYCIDRTKAGVDLTKPVVEYGDFGLGGMGARNDLTTAVSAIKRGANDIELIEEMPNIVAKYPKFVETVRFAYASGRRSVPELWVVWGPTGVGKTTWVLDNQDLGRQYWKSVGPDGNYTKWYDGYLGQDTIVFDEFLGQIPYNYINLMVNPAPLQIECKNGAKMFMFNKIVFISNKHPNEWWESLEPRLLATFARRVTKGIEFTDYMQYTVHTTFAL